MLHLHYTAIHKLQFNTMCTLSCDEDVYYSGVVNLRFFNIGNKQLMKEDGEALESFYLLHLIQYCENGIDS